MGKILSLIIPCYNAEPYINQLLDCLAPQITDEVEVLIIDDGSDNPFKTNYKWAEIIRQDNKGVSYSRNVGLDIATGEYIAFIDADDLVSDKYVKTIINVAKTEKFDYCYLSWKTLPEGLQMEVKLNSVNDNFPFYNRSVWNRVYKKSFIGDLRFNTNIHIGEDGEFLNALKEEGKKKSFIAEYMYLYRSSTPNSLTKRFNEGKLCTQRIVYHFPVITKKMTFLLDEVKQLSKVAEIIILTNKNEIPQIGEYAHIRKLSKVTGTELRGYYTPFFIKVDMPIKAHVVIWTEKTFEIGGIETFIFNFCKQMSKYYDIVVLYQVIDGKQKTRLSEYATVVQNKPNLVIQCDTLIVNRITDTAPKNVEYKKKVQMVHSCKWKPVLPIPKDNDYLIPVSKAVAKSYPDFKEDHVVINNLTCPSSTDKALILVSATRTGTSEKGQQRMITLSKMLKEKGIPYVWFCFADHPIPNADNICFMKPTLDIAPYIKMADYLVQLSDHEGFCYSMVEALELGTPVLTTPLEVLPELGYKDGETGYIIPFNMDFDITKIFKHPLKGKFEYTYDNAKRIKQWKKILGKGGISEKFHMEEPVVKVVALMQYDDIMLNRRMCKGDVIEVKISRAYELICRKPQLVDFTEDFK